MRARVALLAVVALGCSCAGAGPPAPGGSTSGPPAATSALLTVGSYNVLYLRADRSAGVDPSAWADPDTLRQVQSLDVDVLFLQETNEAWEGAISAVLAQRYPHCVFHPPRRFLPEGLGVCSRHPIEGDSLLGSPVGWFPAQRARLRTPSGPVEILNVHLRPAVAGSESWMEVHRATRPDRRREVEAYLADLPKGAAALVVGDFNELPEGDLFVPLAAAGFESALPRAKETRSTWQWAGTVPLLEAQLDHVAYAASSFELVSAEVRSGGNSDHVPIVVTLRRKLPR